MSLAREDAPLRRVIARLAGRLVSSRAWEHLGFVRLGDYSRERIGWSARELQELVRVDARLGDLPAVESEWLAGRLGWTQVRALCRVATPEDERWWLALANRCSAVELECRVRAIEGQAGRRPAAAPVASQVEEHCERATLRILCDARVSAKWGQVRRLARRVTGEWLPWAEVAEFVAAEVMSSLPFETEEARAEGETPASSHGAEEPSRAGETDAVGFPSDLDLRAPRREAEPNPAFCDLVAGIDRADPRELDRRLRRAVALEQARLSRMAPLIAEVAQRRLYRDVGYNALDNYVSDRLGMSPRKARELLRVERCCRMVPELRAAWSQGRASWGQAQLLVALFAVEAARNHCSGWIERAAEVSLRRLEEDVERVLETGEFSVEALPPLREPFQLGPAGLHRRSQPTAFGTRSRVSICASPEVVHLFRASLAAVRLHLEAKSGRPAGASQALEWICDHVLKEWTRGERSLSKRERRLHSTFARDGWQCTVPGCRSLRNLHAHHIVFRSRGGSDAHENLTTLCAAHHQRGVHGGILHIRGTAPGHLRFDLPLDSWQAGDRRVAR